MALIGAAGMFVLAKHKSVTTYTADRYVLISHNLNKSQNSNGYPTENNADMNMMSSYEDIVKNSQVAKASKKHLSKSLQKKYSANKISKDIDAKAKEQSLVMRISATTDSPQTSVSLVNATAQGLKDELPKIQPGAGEVHLLAKAQKEDVTSKTTPNKKKYVVVGFALGALIGLIISFVVVTWKKVID